MFLDFFLEKLLLTTAPAMCAAQLTRFSACNAMVMILLLELKIELILVPAVLDDEDIWSSQDSAQSIATYTSQCPKSKTKNVSKMWMKSKQNSKGSPFPNDNKAINGQIVPLVNLSTPKITTSQQYQASLKKRPSETFNFKQILVETSQISPC